MNEQIRVLLADDHALLRKGMAALLEREPDMTVVGEAADGQEAIAQARSLKPDVVVMDISMPRTSGIDATRQIHTDSPHSKVIALSIHSGKRFIDNMLNAGASGYLLKESAPEELVQGIRAVVNGGIYLSSAITDTVVSAYMEQLSDEGGLEGIDEETHILRTKLNRPALLTDLIPRTKLLERIESARVRPLTLVSAPAGYGKSTLISSWLEQTDWPNAWYSLEEDDRELRQFLTYFVTAVQSIYPQSCSQTQQLLISPKTPPVSILVTSLSNELNALDSPFILVLDDYHHIDATSPVHDLLEHLLNYPPIPLHLVIINRRDPPLPLLMLRARDQVNEIRIRDLQFSRAETRTLVQKIGEYSPSEEALIKLIQKFEGWVVGLRLVSLAARHVEQPDRFMQQLHGGIRQTQDYLLQEVLSRQSPQLRDWLLKSAVLTRFNEALCNAVCADEDHKEQSNFNGARMIQALQAGNLFVISLDTHDEWFRYHHLFRELLQHELKRSASPQAIDELCRRASAWCEARAFTNEAIQYALQADDMVAAGKIVERHWRTELDHDRWYIVKDWLDLLPQEIIKQRSELQLAELWLTLTQQQFDRLPQLIEQIEAQAEDQPWYPRISQDLRFFHGLLEYWQGHGEKSLSLLETLMHKIPERPGITAGWIGLYYGLALCMQGQRQQAIKQLQEWLSNSHLPPLYRSQLIGAMAFIHLISGELHQANKYELELIRFAKIHKIANTAAWANYLLACTELQANQLDQASHQFETATSQIYILEPKASIDALAGLALTQMLQGQSDDADQTVERIRVFARERNEPEYLSVADSCLARLQVLRGELAPAAQWARSVTTASTPQELFTWLEVPALTRVRVLLAIGSAETLQEAAGQLDAIRATSEACRFIGQMIEVEVLQSLLLEKQGRSEAALQCLGQAIAMAAPGGWIRSFIEAGQPMQRLLERLAKQNSVTDQLSIVLDAMIASQQQPIEPVTDEAERGANRETGLTEPLTKREYDILDLLANRLQNKEIAAKLFVSPETVKSHLKHLFQKLGVSNRRDAAAKAATILSSHTATSHRT